MAGTEMGPPRATRRRPAGSAGRTTGTRTSGLGGPPRCGSGRRCGRRPTAARAWAAATSPAPRARTPSRIHTRATSGWTAYHPRRAGDPSGIRAFDGTDRGHTLMLNEFVNTLKKVTRRQPGTSSESHQDEGQLRTVSAPPVRRRLLGRALRRYRESLGFTLYDAARTLECTGRRSAELRPDNGVSAARSYGNCWPSTAWRGSSTRTRGPLRCWLWASAPLRHSVGPSQRESPSAGLSSVTRSTVISNK